MNRRRPTPRDKVQAIVQATAAGMNASEISRATGVPRRTVSDIQARESVFIQKFIDDHSQYHEPKFKAGWAWAYENTMDEMHRRDKAGNLTPADRKNLMIAAGIATEKTHLVHGKPIAQIDVMSEMRVSLSDVAEKLLRIGRAAAEVRRALPDRTP